MACEVDLSIIWPDDLCFKVPASGSLYINAGGQVITLPEEFKGWKVRVVFNNVPLDSENLGDPYFTQNVSNGFINLSFDTVEGDKIMIHAYKPGE